MFLSYLKPSIIFHPWCQHVKVILYSFPYFNSGYRRKYLGNEGYRGTPRYFGGEGYRENMDHEIISTNSCNTWKVAYFLFFPLAIPQQTPCSCAWSLPLSRLLLVSATRTLCNSLTLAIWQSSTTRNGIKTNIWSEIEKTNIGSEIKNQTKHRIRNWTSCTPDFV